jgi:hypothetical protein
MFYGFYNSIEDALKSYSNHRKKMEMDGISR